MSSRTSNVSDKRVHLPAPGRAANVLMQLMGRRRSSRAFSEEELDARILADLLWTAFGITSDEGHRTAPSARNWQEIDVYVALASGLYRFDAVAGDLVQISRDDIRARTGQQDFVGVAPVNLVYVADHDRMSGASPKERDFYAAADTGFICQNVYLFCAYSGLATVVRGLIDRPALAARMKLRPAQRIILAQTVGRPADPAGAV